MDPSPAASRAAFVPRPGLIVLRALGKFFGLAGARVGFVLAEPIFAAPRPPKKPRTTSRPSPKRSRKGPSGPRRPKVSMT